MTELRLVAVNEAGTHLVLAASGPDDGSADYTLPIDDALLAAVRRDRTRLGQLEPPGAPALRPKDIQARIRAGDSAEAVAAAAGLPLERVERFAGPVRAEREHMAAAAQRAPVRRRSDGVDAPLGELVAARLDARGLDPETMSWDAWRREDGRWAVRLEFRDRDRLHAAQWVYDPAVRVVSCDDDASRRLTEDPAPAAGREAEPAAGRSRSGGPSRDEGGTGAAAETRAGGDTATGAAAEPPAPTGRNVVRLAPRHGEQLAVPGTGGPDDERPDLDDADAPDAEAAGTSRPSDPAGSAGDEAADDSGDSGDDSGDRAEPAARPRSGRPRTGGRAGRRASVPSWDDIVFGRRRDGDTG